MEKILHVNRCHRTKGAGGRKAAELGQRRRGLSEQQINSRAIFCYFHKQRPNSFFRNGPLRFQTTDERPPRASELMGVLVPLVGGTSRRPGERFEMHLFCLTWQPSMSHVSPPHDTVSHVCVTPWEGTCRCTCKSRNRDACRPPTPRGGTRKQGRSHPWPARDAVAILAQQITLGSADLGRGTVEVRAS